MVGPYSSSLHDRLADVQRELVRDHVLQHVLLGHASVRRRRDLCLHHASYAERVRKAYGCGVFEAFGLGIGNTVLRVDAVDGPHFEADRGAVKIELRLLELIWRAVRAPIREQTSAQRY